MIKVDSPWLHWPETLLLAEAVSPLRFVGGCVRDALLNRPVRDVDAATPLPPREVMTLLAAKGIKSVPTGIDHGTITAVIGGRHFEITTLRRDVSTDGRHATVAYTQDWKQDAGRRDFTMNALYCDMRGEVFDYFDGVTDAAAGHVRFIGNAKERITEDALRILRFFRFFAHYGKGTINIDGITACGELAPLTDGLSGERIAQEMLKLLVAEQAAEVVGLMQRHAVWPRVVPAVVKTETLDALPAILRKVGKKPEPLLSLALLLRTAQIDTAKLIEKVAARWKLSKAHHKHLIVLCDKENHWSAANDKQYKKHIRAWGSDVFIDRVIIAMAEGAEEASGLLAIALAKEWATPVFPVTGDDLIALGVAPGKDLGEKLAVLQVRWEESGYVLSKKELLAL